MTDAYYVYAILARGTPVPAELRGFGGRRVEILAHGEIAAATSVVDSAGLRPTVEAVLKHEEVVENLRESVALIPVRFGTVFPNPDGLIVALSRQHDSLLADLKRLGNKVEFGLIALWPEPSEDRDADEPAVIETSEPNGDPSREGLGTRYLRARVLEQRRDSALRARARALADRLEIDLAPLSLDSRKSILPTPRIAFRAAYLLHPSSIGAFQEAFERTRGIHPDLRFLLIGPWPPYSFVSTSGPDHEASPAGEPGNTSHDQQGEVVHG